MAVISVLLGIACIYLIVSKILIKRELRRMAREIEQINFSDSRCRLTIQVPDASLAQLAAAVNNMRQKYQEEAAEYIRREEEYKQSMADISHDLRTPLTAMKGYLKLLRKEGLEPDRQKEYVEIAYDKSDTLNNLVTSLFELARLECNAYHFEREQVDVREVMEQELIAFYPEFMDRGLEPEIDLAENRMLIYADPTAIQRILNNLIQNVLNHGSGEIRMKSYMKEEWAWVEISNAAPNLDLEDVGRLFTRAYTAERARSHTSSGLGLSIVRAFAEQMEGAAKAELKEGRLSIKVGFPLDKRYD